MGKEFWSMQRMCDLCVMWGHGVRASVIARTLGTSRGAVLGKLDRLGLLGLPKAERSRRQSEGAVEAWAKKSPQEMREHTERFRRNVHRRPDALDRAAIG